MLRDRCDRLGGGPGLWAPRGALPGACTCTPCPLQHACATHCVRGFPPPCMHGYPSSPPTTTTPPTHKSATMRGRRPAVRARACTHEHTHIGAPVHVQRVLQLLAQRLDLGALCQQLAVQVVHLRGWGGRSGGLLCLWVGGGWGAGWEQLSVSSCCAYVVTGGASAARAAKQGWRPGAAPRQG